MISRDAQIVLLVPGDASRWVTLRREMLADTPWSFASSVEDDAGLDPAVTAERLSGPDHVTAAAVGGRGDGPLLSTATLLRDRHVKMRHRGWIVGVYTTPAARGLGLARRVIVRLIAVARERGIEVLCLSASADAAPAVALYASVGFRAWGVEPDVVRVDGRSHDEVHMRLVVGPRAAGGGGGT